MSAVCPGQALTGGSSIECCEHAQGLMWHSGLSGTESNATTVCSCGCRTQAVQPCILQVVIVRRH